MKSPVLFATSSNPPQPLYFVDMLLENVNFPNYLGAAGHPSLSSAVLEAVRNGAGATLDACDIGYWQNVLLAEDSAGDPILTYPVYIVSESSVLFA